MEVKLLPLLARLLRSVIELNCIASYGVNFDYSMQQINVRFWRKESHKSFFNETIYVGGEMIQIEFYADPESRITRLNALIDYIIELESEDGPSGRITQTHLQSIDLAEPTSSAGNGFGIN